MHDHLIITQSPKKHCDHWFDRLPKKFNEIGLCHGPDSHRDGAKSFG